MNNYQSRGENWVGYNPNVIDYNHQRTSSAASQANPTTSVWKRSVTENQQLLQSFHTPELPLGARNPVSSTHNANVIQGLYSAFVQDDLDISDDEKHSQNTQKSSLLTSVKPPVFSTMQPKIRRTQETKSGAAFYQGLILYIPSFEQITNSYKGSPAMKMLYASFEFSFKIPLKIEIKQMPNNSCIEASVTFKDHLIAKTTNTALAAQNEVCVRALELLSETCYTIQAKENYFKKCKMIDALEMKTLNLKKWEEVSIKYPKIVEVTKESHIQKTFSVFLDRHISTGLYEDIICCNLTRQDVMNIKSVVEFFQLTLLPCSITTHLTKKSTPYVISIHKYTSATKLMEILMENGGENDKFKLYSPDTFKDFYKLHHSYWDRALKNSGQNQVLQLRTTLEDIKLQSEILKPYESVVAELFEKHKLLSKLKTRNDDSDIKEAGDDFMKYNLKIDMAHSKTVAPVERMQLLLKYMEQLQEYGNRVLASGQTEMIKIYHNAIDNLRKDLDICSKDIEKEQKGKTESRQRRRSRSPPSRKKTPPKVRSKSPRSRSYNENSKRSISPRRSQRSRTPKRSEKRRSSSPRRRHRSRSPRRPGRTRLPVARPRSKSPSPHKSRHNEESIVETVFKDRFRRFIDILRKFRIEIEDTPIERRGNLRDKMIEHQEQLHGFYSDAMSNQSNLGCYLKQIENCQNDIDEQVQLVAGKPGPNDLPRDLTPPPWMNVGSFEPKQQYSSYGPPLVQAGVSHQPGTALFGVDGHPTSLPSKYTIN